MSDEVVERVARALREAGCRTNHSEALARAALSALHGEEMREKIAAIMREKCPVTCGQRCQREWSDEDEASAYSDATSRIMALLGLNEVL